MLGDEATSLNTVEAHTKYDSPYWDSPGNRVVDRVESDVQDIGEEDTSDNLGAPRNRPPVVFPSCEKPAVRMLT